MRRQGPRVAGAHSEGRPLKSAPEQLVGEAEMCVASQDRLLSESESISSQVLPRVSQVGSLHRAQ